MCVYNFTLDSILIFSDSMKISSIMEQRQTKPQEILVAMRKAAEDGMSNIPVPRAKVAHMQWGQEEEETPQETQTRRSRSTSHRQAMQQQAASHKQAIPQHAARN